MKYLIMMYKRRAFRSSVTSGPERPACPGSRARSRRKSIAPPAAYRDDEPMSNVPEGFTYRLRKSGDVEMFHHGRPAGVLRGAAAARFLVDVENDDAQELMARLTGNYKHGNERAAKNHPRNRRG